MKPIKGKVSLLLAGIAIVAAGAISSCKSKGVTHPGGPKPPSNPGGYDSAAQIQPGALVSYFGFNSSFNDSKHGLTPTLSPTPPTFTSGVKGQAYQGNGSSYLIVPFGSSASFYGGSGFSSFTVSMWLKEAAEPIYATNGQYTPGQGPEGLLFMWDTANNQDLLHMDIEPYAANTQDTVSLNAGFVATGLTSTGPYVGNGKEGVVPNARLDTAIGKWTHVVMTYDGTSSNYTLYENGTAVFANSAWSNYASGPAPVQILTGGVGATGTMPLGVLNFTPAPAGLVIGAWAGTAMVGGFTPNQYTGSYKGAMDELRIYNKALNASDVKSLYLLEHAGF